jgi:hypothetical protein
MTVQANKNTAAIQSVLESTSALKPGNLFEFPQMDLSLTFQPASETNKFPRWAVTNPADVEAGTFYVYHPSNDAEALYAMFQEGDLYLDERTAENEVYLQQSGRTVEGLSFPVNFQVLDKRTAQGRLARFASTPIEFTQKQTIGLQEIKEKKAFKNGDVRGILSTATTEERQSFFGGLAGMTKNLFN